MSSYYYLGASFSPLEFSQKPRDSFASLKESLALNLSAVDCKKVESLRLFVDILNFKPLWQADEIDPRGNLGEKELEESLVDRMFFPDYVFSFLDRHATLEARMHYFPEVLAQFFKEEIQKNTGFLKEFFSFEREWRLVVLALRAKKLHRDLVAELQFEDPTDSFIRQILLQKDADDYDPPIEYKDLKELLKTAEGNSITQNKVIASYRFQKTKQIDIGEPFSVDAILSYLAQLMIVEYWNELDQTKGEAILDAFM